MTRQYDVPRSSESPQKDSDNWILQRSAVRQLPAKPLTPQTESPDSVHSGIKLDLMQIPVSNYSAKPSQLQALAKVPTRGAEDTETERRQGKLPHQAVGEENVAKSPTLRGNAQVQQLMSKVMPVAQRDGGMSVRETPVQCQEQEKKAENKTGLSDRLKEGIESMSGYDLSGVRVNYNSPKPAQLNAHAYTQGQAIEVGPGQERHLPHEAWHVVQQMQGRVRPTMEVNGVGVNDDRGLEQEAEVMGGRVIRDRQVTAAESLGAQSNQIKLEERRAPINEKAESFPIQRTKIKGGSYLEGKVKFTGANINNGNGIHRVAKKMEATNIRPKDKNKLGLGKDNAPDVDDIPGWDEIVSRKRSVKDPKYVRMHLLNGKLGGSGQNPGNLAPGSSKLNSKHSTKVERILQKHVLNGNIIKSYKVTCNYREAKNYPKGIKGDKTLESLYQLTLKGLRCEYELDDGNKENLNLQEPGTTASAWNK
ncbi:DUF4157 domain-containing protein [Moorena producens]|uniref:eCIS core domain-containing protein n=1 Tax=Moorena producens TaxID=1155739 RepID=UPI003C778994